MHEHLRKAQSTKISTGLSDEQDREVIYSMRHQVYARELGQHTEIKEGRLTDKLDSVNCYIVAKTGGEIAGFVSITPPNELGYSIDKYFAREDLPLIFDEGLYEARILTVSEVWRSSRVAALLMYGALRYIESLGGRTVIGIGRLEVLETYKRAGFRSLQRQVRAGKVTFELITAQIADDRPEFQKMIAELEKRTVWNLQDISFYNDRVSYHGGAFFEAIADLIFLSLRHLLRPEPRVLTLDPMYGEYTHVLEKIISCQRETLLEMSVDTTLQRSIPL
jgi:N-acyl-L-homoserine lactone synthetase